MDLNKKLIKYLSFVGGLLAGEGYFGLAAQAIELRVELEALEELKTMPYGKCTKCGTAIQCSKEGIPYCECIPLENHPWLKGESNEP